MAMTKAEKSEMERLKVRLALAWPPEPPKPVDLTVAFEATEAKWLRFWWMNAGARTVGIGVTDGRGISSRSNYSDQQLANRWGGGSRVSMSQGAGGPWFDSEVDAYRALHYAVAEECAALLHNIAERTEAAKDILV